MISFPGYRNSELNMLAHLKFEDGDYIIEPNLKHISLNGLCHAISGNVDPRLSIEKQIPGLPNGIAKSFLDSDTRLVVTTPKILSKRLMAFKKEKLAAYKAMGIPADDKGLVSELVSMDKFIITCLNDTSLGSFYPQGQFINELYGGYPVITIYDLKRSSGNRYDDLIDIASTLQHEIGHAIDWHNGKKNLFASNESNFRRVFNQNFLPQIPKDTDLYYALDRPIQEHFQLYDEKDKPCELVAEIAAKYSHLYNMHPQIAEARLSTDYPYIWNEVKTIIPQIESGLLTQGYNRNARPLLATPSLYFLNDRHVSYPNENGDVYLAAHGLSQNEKNSLKKALFEHHIFATEKDAFDCNWLIIKKQDLGKLAALKLDIPNYIDMQYVDHIKSQAFLDIFEAEQNRIKTLLKKHNVEGHLGFDGSLVLDMPHAHDPRSGLSYMEVNGFRFDEEFEITSSSPDRKSYAVPYNLLPDLYKPNLRADKNGPCAPSF